jgi:hypothetical protein
MKRNDGQFGPATGNAKWDLGVLVNFSHDP